MLPSLQIETFKWLLLSSRYKYLEREIFENVSIFLLGDRALNSRAQQSYNRCVVPRLSVMHGDSGAPPVYDKAELELLVTDQKENLEKQSKRKEVKQGPPSKKRKFTNNIVSRFSYKERKVKEKLSKSEATDSKVTVFNNADGNIVQSSKVITRNSFKGGRPKEGNKTHHQCQSCYQFK